jgi:hypothetical protein
MSASATASNDNAGIGWITALLSSARGAVLMAKDSHPRSDLYRSSRLVDNEKSGRVYGHS